MEPRERTAPTATKEASVVNAKGAPGSGCESFTESQAESSALVQRSGDFWVGTDEERA